MLIVSEGGYVHIPHLTLLSVPAAQISAQYGLAPEWVQFAQQLAQLDEAQRAPASPPPAPVQAEPSEGGRPRPRPRPRPNSVRKRSRRPRLPGLPFGRPRTRNLGDVEQ